MCLMGLPQPHSPAILAPPPLVRDADDAKTFSATLDAMATRRPSWTTLRGVFKQPTSTGRPGLPRRFHTKINLNEYWGVLEKVVKVEVSWPRSRQSAAAATAATAAKTEAMDVDNEVNENLANERAEAEQYSKMDVDDDEDKKVIAEVPHALQDAIQEVKFDVPSSPQKDVASAEVRVAQVEVTEVTVVKDTLSPRKTASPAKKLRRRSSTPVVASPSSPHPCATPPCGATPASPCGAPAAPSACRRVPLGTINGLDNRAQLRKSLSPLSVFADNLARRLARQH